MGRICHCLPSFMTPHWRLLPAGSFPSTYVNHSSPEWEVSNGLETSCLTIQQNSHLSLQDMADGSPSRSARLLCSCCVIYISLLVASQSHSRTGSFVLGYFSSSFLCCLTKLVLSMVTRLEHQSSFCSKVLRLHLALHIGIEEASEGFVLSSF